MADRHDWDRDREREMDRDRGSNYQGPENRWSQQQGGRNQERERWQGGSRDDFQRNQQGYGENRNFEGSGRFSESGEQGDWGRQGSWGTYGNRPDYNQGYNQGGSSHQGQRDYRNEYERGQFGRGGSYQGSSNQGGSHQGGYSSQQGGERDYRGESEPKPIRRRRFLRGLRRPRLWWPGLPGPRIRRAIPGRNGFVRRRHGIVRRTGPFFRARPERLAALRRPHPRGRERALDRSPGH